MLSIRGCEADSRRLHQAGAIWAKLLQLQRWRPYARDAESKSEFAIMRLLRTRRCKLSDMPSLRAGGSPEHVEEWFGLLSPIEFHKFRLAGDTLETLQ